MGLEEILVRGGSLRTAGTTLVPTIALVASTGESQRQLVPLAPWLRLTRDEQPSVLPSSLHDSSVVVVVAVAEKDEDPEVEPPDFPRCCAHWPG